MHYVRTSSGSMMAVTHKSNSQIAEKKQTAVVKPSRKSKKDPISESK
jgi:hypothetical protein